MYKAAKDEASRLKSRIETQNVTIRTQQNEIKRLREALKAMVQGEENDIEMEDTNDKEETEETMSTSEHDVDSDDESDLDSNPLWDKDDGIFRCPSCQWEVIDGLCQSCNKCFDGYDDDAMSETEEEIQCRSVITDNKMVRSDRQLPLRGSTPLLDVDPSQLFPANIANGFIGREEEYAALLMRGATRSMCELFDLEFALESGIVAWADEYIFEEFSGPAMKQGDRWKIHLGRRVRLSKGDIDGSIFMEELLEEALYFPAGVNSRWKTVQERGGVWVTRPNTCVFNKEDFDPLDSERDHHIIDYKETNSTEDQAREVYGGEDNKGDDDRVTGDDDLDSRSDLASVYSICIAGQTTEAIRSNDYESDDSEYEYDSDSDVASIDVMSPTFEAGVRDGPYYTESSSESEDIESDADEDEEYW